MVLLRTFGGLSLHGDGAPLPASATQPQRLALLVLLARAGEPGMSRDTLLSYLWPDASAARARHALDQLVYRTRRDLGREAIVSDRGRLRLDPGVVTSDAAQFDSFIEARMWERAVELYAGPFLDGVYLSTSGELERWVEVERGRLEAKFHGALEQLARAAAERGEAAAEMGWWRRRAAADPLDARIALRLVTALADSGDGAGAVRYARSYAVLVRDELDVEPDARVLAFAEQVAHEPGATEPSSRATGDPASAPAAAVEWSGADRSGRDAPPAEVEPPARARRLPSRTPVAPVAATVLIAILGTALWTGSRRAPVVPDPGPASVAVLPFEDLSADRSAEYLGDGLSEELIHALAQVPDLRVTARTSAFAFKGEREDIRDIARALGVATIVEGSVRRDGDRLRISAQLIEAATGYPLWSGSFDRRTGDALATQNEIARSIVRILRPRLTAGPPAASSPTPSPRAYNLYLQGRYAGHQGTEASLEAALRFFDEAIAEDPSYAAPYVGIAAAHDALADGGFAPAESSYGEAEAAARRALQLDSTLAEAYAVLGHLEFHRWDWEAAERELRRALELNPGLARGYRYYAMPLVMQGRFDEGLAMMRKAQELDPLALDTHGSMGWLLFLALRYPEAIDQLEAVIAIDSTRASSHARLGLSLVESGRHEEGIAALERAVELDRGYYRSALPMLGYAYAKAGRREDAERMRVRVEREMESRSVNPYYAATLMGALGDNDRAFALLDRAYRTNKGCLIDLRVDPMMETLRRDPRYGSLVRALAAEPREAG